MPEQCWKFRTEQKPMDSPMAVTENQINVKTVVEVIENQHEVRKGDGNSNKSQDSVRKSDQ
jgi:hypothetical protein